MVAWRYGIYLPVFISIPHSFAAHTREVISLKLEEQKKITYVRAPMHVSKNEEYTENSKLWQLQM